MSSATSPAATSDTLSVGYSLVGYRIIRVVGAGGFGITYEALNPVTERRVAIKEFFPAGLARRDTASQVVYTPTDTSVIDWALEKFRATTTLLARMDHPNILRVHDYMPLNGTGYMVMEYLEGQTLQELVRRQGALAPERLRPILEPVLEALAYVHGQGLIHRDIAPDNLVITNENRPVLIDFGAVSRDLGKLTQAVATKGIEKAGFTAPEQAVAEARPEPSADIYSLGAVMYHALTGDQPISGSHRHAQIGLYDEPDPLVPLAARRPAQVSSAMAEAVDACLSLRRKDRPASVEILRERLGWGAGLDAPVTLPVEASLVAKAQEPAPKRDGNGTDGEKGAPTKRRTIAPWLLAGTMLAASVGGLLIYQGLPTTPVAPTPAPVEQRDTPKSLPAGDTAEADQRADEARKREDAQRSEDARKAEEARKAQEAQRVEMARVRDLILTCDRAAASAFDADRPSDVVAVERDAIDGKAAVAACSMAAEAAGKAVDLSTVDKRRVQFELGRSFERASSFADAKAWYEKAAEAGSAAAMVNLGALYANARGVTQDFAAARGWLEKAAAAGNGAAMSNLGSLYVNGQGVKQDFATALGWYEKSAAAGFTAALNNLGVLYASGRGVKQDFEAARSWYEKAAAAGDAAGMTNLAFLYEIGVGGQKDSAKARSWFEKAAAAGNAEAKAKLEELDKRREAPRTVEDAPKADDAQRIEAVVDPAKHGDSTVRRPWLGARLQSVTTDIAESVGLDRPTGVIIARKYNKSPAEAAGLKLGDIVLAIDGQPVDDLAAFRSRFALKGINGATSLDILRNAKRQSIQVKLEPAPETRPRDLIKIKIRSPFTGATLVNTSPAVSEELQVDLPDEGAAVTEVDENSTASRAGFKKGDVVVELNGNKIVSTKDLEKQIQADLKVWMISINRGGEVMTTSFSSDTKRK